MPKGRQSISGRVGWLVVFLMFVSLLLLFLSPHPINRSVNGSGSSPFAGEGRKVGYNSSPASTLSALNRLAAMAASSSPSSSTSTHTSGGGGGGGGCDENAFFDARNDGSDSVHDNGDGGGDGNDSDYNGA